MSCIRVGKGGLGTGPESRRLVQIVTLVGRGGRGGGGRHYGGGGRHYGGGAVRRSSGYRGGGSNYGHRNYGHRNYGYGHRNYGYRGYRGGRWYGGRWWGYGVGTCWRWTPAGYVWVSIIAISKRGAGGGPSQTLFPIIERGRREAPKYSIYPSSHALAVAAC